MTVLIALTLIWLLLRWRSGLPYKSWRSSPARELYERRLRDGGRT